MLYRVEGIVVRSFDYGEGNKIITLYTKEFGKVSVMARGAKKLKSRHSAISQLFTYGEYVYYKSGQMGSLNHGEAIASHHKLREDLVLAAYASYIAELVERMLGEQEGSVFLFEQLKAALEALEEGKDAQIVMHLFEMKMLGISGYAPNLDDCVNCGGGEAPPEAFSVALGGMLCRRCRLKDPQALMYLDGVHKCLQLFQRLDIRRLGKIELKPATKQQLKRIMRLYMDNHVAIQFKSKQFLDQMDKYNITFEN